MLVEARSTARRSGSRPPLVALAFLASAGAALVPATAQGEQAELVARVNDEPVTRAELERMVANPLTRREARQRLDVEPDAAALQGLALRKLIHLRLLAQEARRRNIQITEPELDAAITSLRRRFDDLRAFGAWMQEQGLDDRSLFEAVRGDLAADRVRAALVEDVRVSDEDVLQYYGLHAADFRREEVRLQIIAVRDEAAAKEIVAALRDGASFGSVARERSTGMRAAQGGDTGWVALEGLASPLRETVAKLELRQARGPLRRGSELLVVRLSGRREGGTKSLADARPEIETRLLPKKQRAALAAWLTEQEKQARVEVLSRGPADAASRKVSVEAGLATKGQRR